MTDDVAAAPAPASNWVAEIRPSEDFSAAFLSSTVSAASATAVGEAAVGAEGV